MMEERLQKYMAQCGVASRRKCEELILSGKVKVNGVVVTELGVKVNGNKDKIEYNGKIIKPEEILAELERITQKDLECIYITTNAFDIYLNDASSLKMDTNKGITGIYFNTNVNMEKFKVDSIERLVHDTEAFDMFTEYYDEDDEYDYYRIDFKDSEVKIFFNNEL